MTEHLLITVTDAADRLSISRSKMYELLATGAVPSVHIGRSRRIPVDALEAYVEGLWEDGDEPQAKSRRLLA